MHRLPVPDSGGQFVHAVILQQIVQRGTSPGVPQPRSTSGSCATTSQPCTSWIPDGYRLADTLARLGDARRTGPDPHDCVDGFLHAYRRRPEAYRAPGVRAGISVFARIGPAAVERGVESLRRDLESGDWERRNGHLRELDEIDAGYRPVISG